MYMRERGYLEGKVTLWDMIPYHGIFVAHVKGNMHIPSNFTTKGSATELYS
jgi:hypothetical protein